MEFRSDVPLIIMRRKDLRNNEKAFLLWCWINRDSDYYYILTSKRQNCSRRGRTVTWYADYFGIPRPTMSIILINLRAKSIVMTEHEGKIMEVTYVDFKIFK